MVNTPITWECVPGIGWVNPCHPEHPDNNRLAAYERHGNREPPIDSAEFDAWLTEARRLLDAAIPDAKIENSIDALITEARVALERYRVEK